MDVKSDAKRGIMMVCICFAVMFVGGYSQFQISPLASQIMDWLQISKEQYSLLFTFCMFPALVLSIICGMLIDKFGAKKLIAVALVISTVGIVGRIFASSYEVLLACMLVLGLPCVMLTATCAKIMSSYFSGAKLGSMVGVTSSGLVLGNFIAMSTTAWFPSVQAAFVFSGVLSAVVMVLWIFLVKPDSSAASSADADEGKGAAKPQQSISMATSLAVCLKNPYIWIGGLTLMMLMAGQVMITSFMPQALAAEKGMSAQMSGIITSTYIMGSFAGYAFGPAIFGKFKSKRVFLTCCAVIVSLGIAFAWKLDMVGLIAAVLFVTGACLRLIMPLIFAMPVSLKGIGPEYAGTAGGLQATIQTVGATVVPSFVLTPLFGGNFTVLFIAAGVLCAITIFTLNILPITKKDKED